jgi:hypothetical protein
MNKKSRAHFFPANLNRSVFYGRNDAGMSAATNFILLWENATPQVDIKPCLPDARTKPSSPPAIGEALIEMLAPRRRVDAISGDLAERFAEESVAKGERRAKLLFWARVLRSVGPLLWVKIRNGGIVAMIVEIGHRWIS